MNFLRECARRLDEGEDAASVLASMRERYTTERCMSVKTSLVRSMCTPTDEHAAAVRAAAGADEETVARALREDTVAQLLGPDAPRLPPRLAENARALRITRAEARGCKRLAAAAAVRKNRERLCVRGRALLSEARGIVDGHAKERCVPRLALALMLLTGRRTCEILGTATRFEHAGEHSLRFHGQAKKRGDAEAYRIPVLHPAARVLEALATLRARAPEPLSREATSRRYQSRLARVLRAQPALGEAGHAHALRGVYACMALRLFRWDRAHSDAFVAMNLLGHSGLHESLVYTPCHLGDDFAEEAALGDGWPLG